MKLVLASRNKNKITEMCELFESEGIKGIEVLSLDDIGYTEDIEENGTTFEENAHIKASAVAAKGYAAVADDSGICVDALGGAPEIYSARFAGAHGDDAANNKKMLEELRDIPDEKRTAYYVAAIVCILPDQGKEICVRGECHGIILREERGTGGFGYDPLFWFPELDRTFAELTREEKNRVSHRGNAIRAFAKEFKKICTE